MPNDLIQLHNVETGEIIVREMSDEEQAELNALREETAQDKAKKETEAQTLRANKIEAYRKLGLTEAEIEALLPTPKTEEESKLIGL